MSVIVGQKQLQDAMKDLLTRWERTKQEWNDDKAREFEQDFIAVLKPKVRATMSALDRIASVVGQARRECE